MTEFEKQVLEDLSELKTQMHVLVGDGSAGRIRQLEDKVERHEAFVQRAGGLGAAVAAVITMIHIAINYLRMNH
jgi:hypothetical protein